MREDLRAAKRDGGLRLIRGGAESSRNPTGRAGSRAEPRADSGWKPELPDLLELPPLPAVPISSVWECGFVPFQTDVSSSPSARTVLVMVVSDDVPIYLAPISHTPSELPQLAEILASAIGEGVTRAKLTPWKVKVHTADIATLLRKLLAPRGIHVVTDRKLRAFHAVAEEFLAFDSDSGDRQSEHARPAAPWASHPRVWAGWQLPSTQIARFHAAAASFYRAAPWRRLSDAHVLQLSVRGGGSWVGIVVGDDGEPYGLWLFQHQVDVDALFSSGDADAVFSRLTGMAIVITFYGKDELSSAMAQEVRSERWEIAGPEAYPQVLPFNTIAGGITPRVMEDIIAVMAGISRAMDPNEGVEFPADETGGITWEDHENGVRLSSAPLVGAIFSVFPRVPQLLAPSGPEGPGADPMAILGAEITGRDNVRSMRALAQSFLDYLMAPKSEKPLSRRTAEKHTLIAYAFAGYLASGQRVPIAGVNELDLRLFLYYRLPIHSPFSREQAVAGLKSLRLFFGFLEDEYGIICRWADPILRNRDVFLARWDNGPVDPDDAEAAQRWVDELFIDLHGRVLMHVSAEWGGISWDGALGPEGESLARLLERLWLKWRDEVIRGGVRDPEKLREELVRRQHEFERTPLTEGGESPEEIVRREREATEGMGDGD